MQMNKYGRMAQAHWNQWLPERVAAMTDPQTFFSMLGEEVQRQIHELSAAIAGADKPGEQYLEKLGRLRTAQMTAESEILRAEVLLAPDSEQEPEPKWPGDGPWMPIVEDPNDPNWQQLTDESWMTEND